MQFHNLIQRGWGKAVANALLSLLLVITVSAPVVSAVLTPATAYAQVQDPQGNGPITPQQPPAAAATAGQTGSNGVSCSVTSGDISPCILAILYAFAVWIPSTLAFAAGYFFNFAIQLGLNSAAYGLDFLSQGWAIVRDIANLMFIFILIYIAYTIIVQAETAGTMRMLAGVVVMALLINFSFFLTRVVIDAGNILAVQFYNAIPIEKTRPSLLGGTTNQPLVKDLTAGIMDAVQVQRLLGTQSFQASYSEKGFLSNLAIGATIYIAVGIFLTLLAFTFLMVGVRLVMRIIILWLAIIASPLAFVAHAIPATNAGARLRSAYNSWFTHLLESAFYPAVFLFLFYIMSMFVKGLSSSSGGLLGDVFAGVTPDDPTNMGLVSIIANVGVRMGLVTVLLYFAMKASDAFSSFGSGATRNIVSWAGGAALGVTAGAVAFGGRNTLGRGASALSRTSAVQNLAAKAPFVGGVTMSSLKGVAGSSFDARNSSTLKPGLNLINRTTGLKINPGAGSKATYETGQQRRIQRIQKLADNLKPDAKAIRDAQEQFVKSIGGSEIFNSRLSSWKDTAKQYKDQAQALQYKLATNKNLSKDEKKETEKLIKQSMESATRAEDAAKDLVEAGARATNQKSENKVRALAGRVGNRNFSNLAMPSRSSLEAAAALRAKLKVPVAVPSQPTRQTVNLNPVPVASTPVAPTPAAAASVPPPVAKPLSPGARAAAAQATLKPIANPGAENHTDSGISEEEKEARAEALSEMVEEIRLGTEKQLKAAGKTDAQLQEISGAVGKIPAGGAGPAASTTPSTTDLPPSGGAGGAAVAAGASRSGLNVPPQSSSQAQEPRAGNGAGGNGGGMRITGGAPVNHSPNLHPEAPETSENNPIPVKSETGSSSSTTSTRIEKLDETRRIEAVNREHADSNESSTSEPRVSTSIPEIRTELPEANSGERSAVDTLNAVDALNAIRTERAAEIREQNQTLNNRGPLVGRLGKAYGARINLGTQAKKDTDKGSDRLAA